MSGKPGGASKPQLDPYVDPESGVLFNLVGAETTEALEQAEANLVGWRAVDIRGVQVLDGSLVELQAAHWHLFQDVYPWAGAIRTVDMRKDMHGSVHFAPHDEIEAYGRVATEKLREDNLLRGLPRETFVTKLAEHYDRWNEVHPFRDGNGRAQRVFLDRMIQGEAHKIHWAIAHGTLLDTAAHIARAEGDLEMLTQVFKDIVETK